MRIFTEALPSQSGAFQGLVGPPRSLLVSKARRNGARPASLPFWLEPFPRLRFLDVAGAAARRRALRRRIERARRILGRLGMRAKAAALRPLELQTTFREQTLEQYLPFIIDNRYVFEAHNMRNSYAELLETDRRRLPWDPESIDWPSYWRDCQIAGIKKWVQQEAVREWSVQI